MTTPTRDDILTTPAGRELDKLVAELVMGHPVQACPVTMPDGSAGSRYRIKDTTIWVPQYSRDITAAMDVLCEARGTPPANFCIGMVREGYFCWIGGRFRQGVGATISEAICRAALDAGSGNPPAAGVKCGQ